MIVVDAGAWVRSLVDKGPLGHAARYALTEDAEWAAPPHMPIEALRALRRYEFTGVIATAQADAFAEEVRMAEVRYARPEVSLLAAVWGYRHNFSPYDAAYVALADSYGVPLVTADERLARAALSVGVTTRVPSG